MEFFLSDKIASVESPLRIIFMGTPEFAVPSLEHLVANKYSIIAVYTQPDKPVGRRAGPLPSPVKKVALAHGLAIEQPASLKTPEAIARLAALRPDAIVVAAFGQILPPAVLEIPRYGCLNVHPSLLPKCRGASPVAAAILVGDEFSGVTIMLMDKGMDTGPVLARAAVAISRRDNAGSLTAKLSLVGARLLQEVLVRWPTGEIVPRPQIDAGATFCTPLAKEAGELDWRLPAEQIWRRVRAFNPWPGCYTRWRGRQVKIIEAEPLPSPEQCQPGQIVSLPAGFGVCTGEGILGVSQVQLEGKKAMSAAEFLRGQREFIGARLQG